MILKELFAEWKKEISEIEISFEQVLGLTFLGTVIGICHWLYFFIQRTNK